MEDPAVAFVQTPQYYANADQNRIAQASWAQQALFFGAIARGKDGVDSVFCCGTNVLFRREAFESVGGFPTNSLTEDYYELDLAPRGGLEVGLRPDAVARARPRGHGRLRLPRCASARGCPSDPARAAARPLKLKVQYVLSASYFPSGWTVLIYMSFPVIRLLTGGQPIADITAPEFLLHFAPYFAVALTTAALAGAGSYTFAAFALAAANFWIHCSATVYGAAQGGLVRRRPRRAPRRASRACRDARAGGGGDTCRGQHLRSCPRTGRRHAQQRLLCRRARLDPDATALAGARRACPTPRRPSSPRSPPETPGA